MTPVLNPQPRRVVQGTALGAFVLVAASAWSQAPPPAVLHAEWGPETALLFGDAVQLGSLPDTGNFIEHAPDTGSWWPKRSRSAERGVPQAPHASKTGPKSRAYINRFFPGGGASDPTLAVGTKYLLVSRYNTLTFFDKQQPNNANGAPLPSFPGGVKTDLDYLEFFSAFVAPTNQDGSVNQNNINRYLRLGPNPPLGCDATQVPVYPKARPYAPTDACVNEFYDARVQYDAIHKRFIAVAQARNTIGVYTDKGFDEPFSDTQTVREYLQSTSVKGGPYSDAELDNLVEFSPTASRYLAFAVSRTEDPRDGFHQYILTKSN